MEITYVRGDRRPSSTFVVRSSTGPYDLSAGSTTARLRAWDDTGAVIVDSALVIVDAVNGKVRWDPGAGETTLTPGRYRARVRVMDGGTLQVHFPNDGWDSLLILTDTP